MKFKRYLGFDCDSIDGFNNGQYLDNSPVTARDYDHAVALCTKALSDYLGIEVTEYNSEDVSHGDGPCIQVITGHFNTKNGEELTEEQIEALTGEEFDNGTVCYRYVYVSAEQEYQE